MSIERRPLVGLAAGAATVSLAPILVKAAGYWNVGPNAIALWRCVFGGALLVILVKISRQPLRVERRLAWLLIAAGLTFAIDLTVWHQSIFLAGAALATVIFGERLTPRFLAAAISALAGLTLLVGVGSAVDFNAEYVRGILFGLATGLVYGVFLTLLRSAALRDRSGSTLIRPT